MPGDLTVIEILNRLRQLDVAVRLDNDRLIVDAPKNALTKELRAELSRHKSEIISFLRSSTCSGGDEISFERAPREGPLPLSQAQERCWFLDQLSPGGIGYLICASNRVNGDFDVEILRRSLEEIVRRHESLRTVFQSTDGVPYAVISAPGTIEIPVIDLRDFAPAEREAGARQLVEQNAREPFDLARGPLWRMKVLRLGEREHVVLSAFHHIVFDGWSTGIFTQEMVELYNSAQERRAPVLSPLPFQFADFVQWQKRRLNAGSRTRNLKYWKAALGEKVQPLDLPVDRPHSTDLPPRGNYHSLELPAELSERLKALSHSQGASLYMTLLATFHLLLHRLTQQEKILVGTPVAGRDRTETERLIGFFINTIVMPADFKKEQTFRELLHQVRETALGAYAHQDMPIEELVAAVDPERDLNRAPLFQVFFNHQNMDLPKVEVAGVRSEWYGDVIIESKFHMTLYVWETPKDLSLSLVYNAQMFNADRIKILLEQYRTLLEQIVKDPDRLVGQYSLVTASAKRVLPDPTVPLEVRWTGSLQEHFLAQAAKRPNATAVSGPSGEWSYSDLEQWSGQLAAWLGQKGIGDGDIVAIYGYRSAPLVLALLGVLRAGAAFCILDPSYPALRLCRSLEAAQPKAWLEIPGAGELPESLRTLVDSKVGTCQFRLPKTPQDARKVHWPEKQVTQKKCDPDSLAYVTFTSGTTGDPKCILGTHRPLTHFLEWHCLNFGLQRDDRFSMLSGLSHDPLLRDIFTPLWLGATLCIPKADEILSPGYLADWMQEQRITVCHITPAMAMLLEKSAGNQNQLLRYIFTGGDVLTQRAAANLKRIAPKAQIVNFYGTTETPQAMAWHPVNSALLAEHNENPATAARHIPIGNSIDDVQVLILNRAGGLAGPGELGEIFIRTPYLTLGYANDSELTEERFIVNPFTGRDEDCLYKTGDLGRYAPNGIVEFVGRSGQQVKIRGYRVELGEIETALASHEAVGKCVVLARKENGDSTRLVAYVVPKAGNAPAIQDLRIYLKTFLPEPMLPSTFVFLEAIPLTPNGKVDHNALPIPGNDMASHALAHVAPRNQVERMMAEIWSEVLQVKNVGIHDHFFELGGHSLTATQLIARLRAAFQVDFPLKSVFIGPTIAEMSKNVLYDPSTRNYRYVNKAPAWSRLIPAQPKGSRPPLFVVAGYMTADDTLLVLSRIFPFLGLDQPVFGLQPRWLDGQSSGYTSVEEVAQEFLAEIRAIQPEGPYLLGGDCVGGIIAMEMAEELLRQGKEVGLLVMSDTERPTPYRSFLADARMAWRRGEHILEVLGNLFTGKQGSRIQILSDLVRRKVKPDQPKTQDEAELDSVYRLRMDYRRLIYHHKVKKYSGRITLIVNEGQYKFDKNMGWKGVAAGGLEIISTPGDHWTRYTHHGKEFAERLLACLERAQRNGADTKQSSREINGREVAISPAENLQLDFDARH